MIAKKLSAALAADCSCIIKPSLKTPLTMIALFALIDEKLDLPRGKVNLVIGKPKPIGDTLCEHPAVRILSFTGSTEVGKYLIEKSAEHVKRLTLELGGNAPFIVFDDADLDRAADQLIANKFRGGGQTCVCANRVFVHRKVLGAFADKLVERVEKMTVGDGMKEETDMGPLIDRAGFEKVRTHVKDALERGAQKVAGGSPEPPEHDFGFFHPPTVLRGVTDAMVCAKEETFGPLVPLMAFESEEEVIRRANDTEFGLAAYLFTADPERAGRVIAGLQFGHVGYNTGTGPTPEAPFGGMKQSGYGREGGIEGLHDFIEPQTVPKPS
jgi:succinate-semialdehyde dehydrogenase/glutarate-semialdehyde dehydrogenase